MTFENHEKFLKEEIFKKIEKFPYVIVNDFHKILDQKMLTGLNIVPYETEKDYANVRLKSEKAKAFFLEPTIFLFRNKSAEQFLLDLFRWFEHIDIDEKILEYLSENLNIDISILKAILPLAIRIFKEKKTNLLEQMSAKMPIDEETIKVDAVRDFLLSILLDEDITTVDSQEKTCKLFRIIFDPRKYEYLQGLQMDTELTEIIESTFSINRLIQKCLVKPDLRKNLCTFILARYCIRNFSEERKEPLIHLLIERYKLKEEKNEVNELYEVVESEISMLHESIKDAEYFQSIDEFVRDYEKQWFTESSTVSEFEVNFDEYQGLLTSEFEYSIKKIHSFIENIPAIKIEDIEILQKILQKLKSWPIVRSDKKYQIEIENLSNLVALVNLTVRIAASHPRSWDEWTNIYETYILEGDKLFSNFKEQPTIFETKIYEIVTKKYSEIRSKALIDYEMLLLRNYPRWVNGDPSRPKMVTDIVNEINSLLRTHDVIFFIVYDGMRLDFWNVLKKELKEKFKIREERILSLIPSETIFSRRAIFSGLLPKDISSFDEHLLIRKKIRTTTCYEIGKIKKFDNLIKRKEKLRVFVYGLIDEIGHHFKEGLSIALDSFERIAKKHAQYFEKIKFHLKELGKVVIVIASDHGFIQASELREISLPKHVDWLYCSFHPRFVVFGKKRKEIVAPYEIEDLVTTIEQQNLGHLIRDPKKLKIVKPDGSIEVSYTGEQVDHPLFLLFAKSETRFFKPGGREPPEFAHGGLSPHETIVPFAILEPDK